MNCDATFDILTRGPFPTGNDYVDEPIERHLAACHDCRQLAEALRPAVGLFHEAMAETDALPCFRTNKGPGYSGELTSAADGPLRTLVAPAAASRRRATTGNRRPTRLIWACVAACVFGFVAGMWGMTFHADQSAESASLWVKHEVDNPGTRRPDREGRLLLASFNLPDACRKDVAALAGYKGAYECCTRCHAAAESAQAPVIEMSVLVRSCIACHSRPEPSDSLVSAIVPPSRPPVLGIGLPIGVNRLIDRVAAAKHVVVRIVPAETIAAGITPSVTRPDAVRGDGFGPTARLTSTGRQIPLSMS